jgi:hypothetical protein
MSRGYDYSYRLARERERQIRDERTRATVEGFYQRYRSQYEEMCSNGYEKFIPQEMSRLQSDLAAIASNLSGNPQEVQNISRTVGSYIFSLHGLGRAAKAQFEQEERLRAQRAEEERRELERLRQEKQQQNRVEALSAYYEAIGAIKDPITRDFAKGELDRLKDSFATAEIYDAAQTKRNIETRVAAIIEDASQKAETWKREKAAVCAEEAAAQRIETVKEVFQTQPLENTEKQVAILKKIEALQSHAHDDPVVFDTMIAEAEQEAAEAVITESVRKEVVKSIVKSLRELDFTVDMPTLIDGAAGNYVKITAKKPSGKRAECRVGKTGKLIYKFDEYEGMTCLKDIETFNARLEDVYSVKLSDERITWENPDKISKDSIMTMEAGTKERSR